MKVLFYCGRYVHTLHKTLFRFPPEGVTYLAGSPELANGRPERQDFRPEGAPGRAWRNLRAPLANLATAAGLPNLRLGAGNGCDLIHSTSYPLVSRQPWVVEVEDASVFLRYSRRATERPLARRLVEAALEQESCRGILPWTEAARKSLLNTYDCRRFASKIRVLYPAIDPKPAGPAERRAGARLELLFVGAAFHVKGGYETLLAAAEAHRDYPVHLSMVTRAPAEIVRQFAGEPYVTFYSGVGQGELERLFRKAHGFILPTHTDTFGFVFLEAMSYGAPAIGSDLFAVPEIIEDGVTGLVVRGGLSYFDPQGRPRTEPARDGDPFVAEIRERAPERAAAIAGAIRRLAADEDFRLRLARQAQAATLTGRFSFARRNQAAGALYREACA